MRTNLSDSEKEFLLKFFLLHGTMETIDQKYIWKFDSDYVFLPFEDGLVKTIIKAQDNLRNTMFFNDDLKDYYAKAFEKELIEEDRKGSTHDYDVPYSRLLCELKNYNIEDNKPISTKDVVEYINTIKNKKVSKKIIKNKSHKISKELLNKLRKV